jgi:Icc-related predicted phosphoesterase
MSARKLRVAAISDIHYGKHSRGTLHDLFAEVSSKADVFLLCGDLTDYGLAEEAAELVVDLRAAVRVPILGVLGNHDFESGQPELVRNVLEQAGVTMFAGECTEIQGVGFAGVCGFGGGFGRRMLNAWGEPVVKKFVQEAIDQAVRLEQALIKLQTERRVVLLHYSPNSTNLRRRVARSLSVPRLDALGGAHQSIPRDCDLSRARAQWRARGGDRNRHPRPQCLDAGIAKIRAKRVAFSHRGNLRCTGDTKTESK